MPPLCSIARGCAFLALLAPLTAQGQFVEYPPTRLMNDAISSYTGEFADLDGDGDLDLMADSELFLNDSSGPDMFNDVTSTHMPSRSGRTRVVALADVDGDGDLDFFSGVRGARNQLFLNDGSARFVDVTATHLPGLAELTIDASFVDVDADGDVGLFLANGGNPFWWQSQDPTRLYLNDGSGRFSDATRTHLPARNDYARSVNVGDLDNDGDPDLIMAIVDAPERIYLNDGTGHFVDATSGRLSAVSMQSEGSALGDVDGDGDLDFLVVQVQSQGYRLYLNDGLANFSAPVLMVGEPGSPELADVDGDGDLDLACNELLLNDGSGGFAPSERFIGRVGDTFGDVDGDGDLDMFRTGLWTNDGSGRFDNGSLVAWFSVGQRRDMDGDGVAEFIADTTEIELSRALLEASDLSVGDLNGDGELDAVDQAGMLFFGDGTRVMRGSDEVANELLRNAPPFGTGRFHTHLGDADGDGDLDLFFASGSTAYYWGPTATEPRLFINDGTGSFTRHPTAFGGVVVPALSIRLGDVDGDGDLDAIFGVGDFYGGGSPMLWVNDGSGQFHQKSGATPAVTAAAVDLDLGDIDADGDLDLVTANVATGPFGGQGVGFHVLVNDGFGQFTNHSIPGLDGLTIDLADFDEDGDLDALYGGRLFLNDGLGNFGDVTGSARFPTAIEGLVGDVDFDGDLDILCQGPATIAFNLQRQIHVDGFVRISQPYELRYSAKPGFAGPHAITAASIVGFDRTEIATPFGSLRVDPFLAVALPGVVFPANGGEVRLSLTLPGLPALVGREILVQGLFFDSTPGSGPRLSNLSAKRVLSF